MKNPHPDTQSRFKAAQEHIFHQTMPNRWPEVILAAVTATAIVSLIAMPPLLGVAVWLASAVASLQAYMFVSDVINVKKDMTQLRKRAEEIEREKSSPSPSIELSPSLSHAATQQKPAPSKHTSWKERSTTKTAQERDLLPRP
jgi:hypothetical protein